MSRAFRLAGLLRLRAMAEERAAVELAGTTRRRDAAAALRAATQAALAEQSFDTQMDTLGMQAVVASRLALSALLVDRRAAVEAEDRAVEAADAAWAAARTRTRTLEKLEERHVAAERVEEQRAEQNTLDEIAGRRGTRRTAGPGEDA